ncbi:RagB/SusD family nutrient uptake outer membrane protein [Ginsengibacter hankyongi]|uniref:RagB/SusD family nutrient uptake outer membrane protein n=1 Tax=Ginsengibacter hankyongi TaxID=2607284 RepID=A0A5J5IAE3_9BACT|nr:RagB/SusD family nutrient uptake outer membrane protein [Ginsengibacter hankyongi]KAA9034356.1 RagB/SusD family nutrient uptake outer membrane protein [Ginsengibacter hankyongi]
MNKTFKCFFYALFIPCFLLTACEKNLNLVPQVNYSEATFFKTPDQFKLFANQFYIGLPNETTGYARDSYSDILANVGGTNTISNGSYFAPASSSLWENAYITIRNTTYLIDKVNSADPSLKSQVAVYGGEARFFRAMAYFNLLRDYGGVPIVDKVLTLSDNDILYGPRNTREEVTSYLLKDLDSAINDLPVEANIAGSDKGRVSQGAALALEARIALFEGTWREFRGLSGWQDLLDIAINASKSVMTSSQYSLFDRRDVLGDSSYRYFFILDNVQSNAANLTKSNQNEYIFVNRFDNNIRPAPGVSGNNSYSPTRKFADMFLCKDGLPIDKSPLFQGKQTATSEYQNRDLRMTNDFCVPFKVFWGFYPPEYNRTWSNPYSGGVIYDVLFGRTTSTGYYPLKFQQEIARPLGTDYPVIRYAEVLLINAEALFEKNGSITNDELNQTINLLRARAGVAPLTNELVAANGLDMRTEIRRERTIELSMEGFRFDDIRRWKTAEDELPQALEGVKWTGTQYATDPRWADIKPQLDNEGYLIVEPSANRHFDPAKNYLMPLPTRQILLDNKLEQNPGW